MLGVVPHWLEISSVQRYQASYCGPWGVCYCDFLICLLCLLSVRIKKRVVKRQMLFVCGEFVKTNLLRAVHGLMFQ